MRGGWLVVILFASLLSFAPPSAVAPHTGGSSTFALFGEFRDVEIDATRGRLYVTDTATFSETPPGLVAVDLETHAEVARFPVSNLRGLALSPNGARLAVGSSDGALRLVNPDMLQIDSYGYFSDAGTSAYFWDLAFDGEDRLVASLGSHWITCEGAVIVVDLTAMSTEARFSEPPCGIGPYAGVEVDAARGRLYVLQGNWVFVYDLRQSPIAKIAQVNDGGFTSRGALSPDGVRLYFSSGKVFDALSLTLLADTGRTGDIALASGFGYFHQGVFIDRVRWSDYGLDARFAFRGWFANGPDVLRTIAVDTARSVAYVTVPDALNANRLHAVPLRAGFFDPNPFDGWVVPFEVYGVSVVASGIDSVVTMEVDGQAVMTEYDPTDATVGYAPPEPWIRGTHTVRVEGRDGSGAAHALSWQFSIDTEGPEIYLDDPDAAYPTAHATVTGRIVDLSLAEAWANGKPLSLGPNGNFSFAMNLQQGGNRLYVDARDEWDQYNGTSFLILHVPPTTRYSDGDAGFSIEYPSNWSSSTDVVLGSTRAEVVIEESTGANLNVIAARDLPGTSEGALLQAAEVALTELRQLPSFSEIEAPHSVSIAGLAAVTYAYSWEASGVPLFQRQYIAAERTTGRGWILTFTSSAEAGWRYDPLFQWMAESLRGGGTGPNLVLLVGVAILAGSAVLVLALALRRRARPPPEAISTTEVTTAAPRRTPLTEEPAAPEEPPPGDSPGPRP